MPHIISPYREIEITQKARVSGHVKIKKVDREGRTTFESEFDNIITDEFLKKGIWGANDFGGVASSFGMALGTGVQTTPQATDTALGNLLTLKPAYTAGIGSIYYVDVLNDEGSTPLVLGATPSDDYRAIQFTTTFDYSEAVGDLTELGIMTGRGTTANDASFSNDPTRFDLLSRALIRDNTGTPVILTKSSSEKLIIEYEWRRYRDNEPTATINLNGQDIKFYLPCMARNYVETETRDLLDLSLSANTRFRDNERRELNILGTSSFKSYDSTYAFQRRELWFWQLHKDVLGGHPSINRASEIGGGTDLTNNVFTANFQIEPDVADRTGSAIGDSSTQHPFWPNTASAPQIAALFSPATHQINHIGTLDPVTNQLKNFTLPAGYRLDIQISFERTR